MPPHFNQTGFTGVRFRPGGRFYAEIHAIGERIVLGTFDTAELGARAYDAATWRLGRSPTTFNFRDCNTLAEAEFVAGGSVHLISAEEHRRRRQLERRLDIAEADERAMAEWRHQFPQDVLDEEAFFAQKRAEHAARRAQKMEVRWKKAFIEAQKARPQTISDNDDRWLDDFLTTPSESSVSNGGEL